MQSTLKRKRKQPRSKSGRFRSIARENQLAQSDVRQPDRSGDVPDGQQQGLKNAAGARTPPSPSVQSSSASNSEEQASPSKGGRQRKLVPVITRLPADAIPQYQKTADLEAEPQRKLVPVVARPTPAALSEYQRLPQTQEIASSSMTAAGLIAPPTSHSGDSMQDELSPLPYPLHQVPVSWINMLQHSASNTSTPSPGKRAGSPWSGELRYPSGYSERFVLSRNKSRPSRSKHGDDGLQPIDDLLRTIEVILQQATSKPDARVPICVELEKAWKQGKRSIFEQRLEAANGLIASPLRLARPSSAMIEHFLEQLYDRAVSPYVGDLNRNKKSREGTYGEIQPAFLSRILKQLGINRNSVYLDLGCGVGNTVMQAALETGCEAHGIEREAFPHLVGSYHLQQYHIRSMLWGMRPGKVQLYNGDFLQSPTVDAILPEVDLVLANNVMFGPETNTGIELYARLVQSLKKGARVVSLRPLAMAKLRKVGGGNDSCLAFEARGLSYEEGSVSWSGKSGTYYISTKQ